MKKNIDVVSAMQTFFLNSVLPYSMNIYTGISKAFESGAEVNVHIAMHDYNKLGMGFGLKAMENIDTGKELFRVPIVSGFNGKEMENFVSKEDEKIIKNICHNIGKMIYGTSDHTNYEKMYQSQMITFQLIINILNTKSFFHEFVSSFPMSYLTNSIFISPYVYSQIKSRNLKLILADTKNFQDMLYELAMDKSIYDISKEEYLWAYNNANSRKITFINENPNDKFSKGSGIFDVLLPIFDYINHTQEESEVNCRFEPNYDTMLKKSYVLCIADRNIKPEEQILLNYGSHNNTFLLNKYGFCLRNNKIKESNILILEGLSENIENSTSQTDTLVPSQTEDNIYSPITIPGNETHDRILFENLSFKKELLKKNKLTIEGFSDYNLTLYINKFDIKIKPFLRIMLLSKEDIEGDKERIFNHNFTNEFNVSNERMMWSYMSNTLKYHLKSLESSNYSDLIEGIGEIDNKDKFDLKNILIIEEEEKLLLSKNIEFIKNKLL